MRAEGVKLYDSGRTFKKHISPVSALRMVKLGDARLFCEYCGRSGNKSGCIGKRPQHHFAAQLTDLDRLRQCDPTTITAHEMGIYAGLHMVLPRDWSAEEQDVALKVDIWGEDSIRTNGVRGLEHLIASK